MALDDDKDISSSEHIQEGLSKEELGRLVASRWTGENPNIEKEEAGRVEDDHDAESDDDEADHEHEDGASTEEEDDEEDEKDVEDDQNEADEAAEAFGSSGMIYWYVS